MHAANLLVHVCMLCCILSTPGQPGIILASDWIDGKGCSVFFSFVISILSNTLH